MIAYYHADDQNDPLLLGLLLAAILHVLLIVGITFSPEQQEHIQDHLVIDIHLAPRQDSPEIKDAKYLAQSNQEGRSESQQEIPPQKQRMVKSSGIPQEQKSNQLPRILTSQQSEKKIETTLPDPLKPPEKKAITGAELINRSMELIQLDEQLQQDLHAYAEMPKQTYISTRTKEYAYANYMSEWVNKVERIGNLNYPDQVRRKGLTGNLLLDVAIKPNGRILSIKILRSSGSSVMDDAAIHIVHLSAPFAPFSKDIRKKTDILHITRTWEFVNGNALR